MPANAGIQYSTAGAATREPSKFAHPVITGSPAYAGDDTPD
jgi:hypothetical protein